MYRDYLLPYFQWKIRKMLILKSRKVREKIYYALETLSKFNYYSLILKQMGQIITKIKL